MTTYRLDRRQQTVVAPVLDEFQQRVVDHPGGPLLVLAGPGTGKTTTMVEAIVDLVEQRGVDPGAILALTFSRKAAEQLRDRVTARLGRTMSTSLSSTFHSFAYGLLRAHSSSDRSAEPLKLLSAAEQDVVLRELLTNAPESVTWPDELRAAVGTRGFASEVQAVLSRAREKRLDAAALQKLGSEEGRLDWVAAGQFMEQYLTNLDSQSAIDYANLVFEAVNIAAHPDVLPQLRARYSHVFVDEYQDTDPSQVALLRALAGDGRNLVVVGDPDQSIYAFRGAEVRGILEFPDIFRQRDGSPAPVVALGATRRFGSRLLRASRSLATALPLSGQIPAESWQAFRQPTALASDPGKVEVVTYDTARAETEHIADALRRAHLEDGIPWSEMAVLVRSGRTTIPSLRRSLTAAGVPVEVASDETPLVREPAVQPLLDALRAVVNLDNDDPMHPDYLDPGRVESLLLSPIGGLDATEVRAVARALRRREKAEEGQRSSTELVRVALLDPALLEGLTTNAARKARRLAELLRRARAQLEAHATAEEVLWTLWTANDWRSRLQRSATSGGPGALMAHRDLDAICALFETAARAEEQAGYRSVASFVETLVAQQIPADTLAERGVRDDAVRLLTAHRSKGLEWRFVVVAHVQEGTWPDLRRRTSLLHADSLGTDGPVPPLTMRELLAEERRLFYVACTRPRQRLLVTAVRSPEDDGEQPSRFLGELGSEQVPHTQGRPRRPLSLAGLVAELRRTTADDSHSPALRQAAARRLAELATLDDGTPVPQADPATWWGSRARSRSELPIRPGDEPVVVSASMFSSFLTCPARWFFESEAGGATVTSAAQGFGNLVHAIADRVVRGEVTSVEEVTDHVDRVWERMEFRTPWSSARERAAFELAVQRFLTWHREGRRELVGTEQRIDATVSLDGVQVRLRGYVDRLEIAADGRAVVVDLKTGKGLPTAGDLKVHPQLRLYQLAVDHGGADAAVGRPVTSGGAELVQLRACNDETARVQPQEPLGDDQAATDEVRAQLRWLAESVRGEHFQARAGQHCRDCDFTAICPVKGAGTVLS